jgi:hypothetical protein
MMKRYRGSENRFLGGRGSVRAPEPAQRYVAHRFIVEPVLRCFSHFFIAEPVRRGTEPPPPESRFFEYLTEPPKAETIFI